MELRRTTTPRGTRYYVNGTRVTRGAYEAVRFGRSLECFANWTVGNKSTAVCYVRVGGAR
jgi:hypothetical protein